MKKGYIRIQISEVWEVLNKPHRLFSTMANEVEKLPEGEYQYLGLDKITKKRIVKKLKNLKVDFGNNLLRIKEICICAAIRLEDFNGEILIIRGDRHRDCYLNKHQRQNKDEFKEPKAEEGFITSKNRFVGREDGYKLQVAAGIESISKEGYNGERLFSEDLY